MVNNMYLTILGLNYEQKVSKQYELAKALISKLLSKQNTQFTLSQVAQGLKKKGIDDINYFTILKIIKEVVDSNNIETNKINVNIEDITISINDLPF